MLKGKRVLVVEDVEAERMLISTFLQHQGCRLYQALDGIDGINKARLLVPDLILMDVDIPHCNGFAACKLLSEDSATSHIPIIFLSAYDSPQHRVEGLLAGAVDFIGKPFDFDEVRLRMVVHLRNHINNAIDDEAPDSIAEEGNRLYELLFHAARVHLLAALAEPPGIHQLAAMVGSNSKRLNEAFRHCAGVTVFEYLREERMKEARQLLANTNLSVSEVAYRVGFRSSANFATSFRERFAMTPSQFRKEGVNPPN